MAKGVRKKVDLGPLPDNQRYLAHFAASRNPGFIYFLVCKDIQLVKIGASNRWKGLDIAVQDRIDEHKYYLPFIKIDHEFVMLASALGRTETELLHHFEDYRIAGEWFHYTDDLKVFVDNVGELLAQLDAWEEDGPNPTATPWRLLESKPKPPTKKFKGLRVVIED